MPPRQHDASTEASPGDSRLSLLYDLQASLRDVLETTQALEFQLQDGREHSQEGALALVTLIATALRDMTMLLRQLETADVPRRDIADGR